MQSVHTTNGIGSPGPALSSSSVWYSSSVSLPALSPDRQSAPAPATERRSPERGRARLEADGLTAYFGTSAAIRNVSLPLRDREVTAVIGPSKIGRAHV